jgi:tetratricopeptide (TPR) repeat protein
MDAKRIFGAMVIVFGLTAGAAGQTPRLNVYVRDKSGRPLPTKVLVMVEGGGTDDTDDNGKARPTLPGRVGATVRIRLQAASEEYEVVPASVSVATRAAGESAPIKVEFRKKRDKAGRVGQGKKPGAPRPGGASGSDSSSAGTGRKPEPPESPSASSGEKSKPDEGGLAQMEAREFTKLLAGRLSRSEAATLWSRTLNETMDDVIPGKGLDECVEELRRRAERRGRLPELFRETCALRPDLCGKAGDGAPRLINVPIRNEFFTGREKELARLREALAKDGDMAAVWGLPGVGKTALANEFAWRYGEGYGLVLWVSAASEEEMTAGLAGLAEEVGVAGVAEQKTAERAAAVKRRLAERPGWLLILDNVDGLEAVRRVFESGGEWRRRGKVLLTSRLDNFDGLGVKDVVHLETFSEAEGLEFLKRRSRKSEFEGEEAAAARELTRELGGLALALDQAAAYVRETPTTFREYLALYRAEAGKLLRERGGADGHGSVTATFELAFERLAKENPAAGDLVRASAFLGDADMPEGIFVRGGGELGERWSETAKSGADYLKAVRDAKRFALIGRDERDAKEGRLTMQRLVRVVIREKMAEAERRTWAERTVRALNAAYPDPSNFGQWAECERFLAHAQASAKWISEYGFEFAEAGRVLNDMGYYLSERGQYEAARPLYERALRIAEKALGKEHPDTATSLNNLGALYKEQKDYEKAQSLFEQSLNIREKVLGKEHPDTATSLNNLATLYQAQEKYAQAEEGYKQALDIREKVLGKEHADTATTLNSLAALYEAQGEYGKAEALFERALAIREKVRGAEHPDTATSLNNLAALYDAQGEYGKAQPLYERALAIREKALGEDHPLMLQSLNNLAVLYSEQEAYGKAQPLYERALAIREKALGEDHPLMLQSLNNLAVL